MGALALLLAMLAFGPDEPDVSRGRSIKRLLGARGRSDRPDQARETEASTTSDEVGSGEVGTAGSPRSDGVRDVGAASPPAEAPTSQRPEAKADSKTLADQDVATLKAKHAAEAVKEAGAPSAAEADVLKAKLEEAEGSPDTIKALLAELGGGDRQPEAASTPPAETPPDRKRRSLRNLTLVGDSNRKPSLQANDPRYASNSFSAVNPTNLAAVAMKTDALGLPGEGRVVPSLVDYLHVLRRRKWMLLLAIVLVPTIAVLLSMRQTPTYAASAQVLLNRQSVTDSVTGIQAPTVDPARAAQTEAELARVPQVARQAIVSAHARGLTPFEFLKKSSVTATAGSDFLTFSVTHSDPVTAKRLATAWAQAYTVYRQSIDTQQLKRAQEAVQRQIDQLTAGGLEDSALYRSLVQKDRQLGAVAALQTPTAVIVDKADRAIQIGPRTGRNGAIGLVLGLVLGLALAFLWDALDTRVRSVDTIRDGLGLRLLGRLPTPPRHLRKKDRLVMEAEPYGREAEAFRVLRASFDFANAEHHAQTILFTSAVDGEGKSTTVANLAIAFARAGRHVVLIDSDVRRPSVHRFFGLTRAPGLVDVALGFVELEDALQSVPITERDAAPENGTRRARREGRLEVLPAGTSHTLDDLGAELEMSKLIESVRDRADLVLIDAAPLLPVGDAVALTGHVDALVLVLRLVDLRSSALDDLRRTIWSSPAQKLGFIATAAQTREVYTQFHRYGPTRRRGETEEPFVYQSTRAPSK